MWREQVIAGVGIWFVPAPIATMATGAVVDASMSKVGLSHLAELNWSVFLTEAVLMSAGYAVALMAVGPRRPIPGIWHVIAAFAAVACLVVLSSLHEGSQAAMTIDSLLTGTAFGVLTAAGARFASRA